MYARAATKVDAPDIGISHNIVPDREGLLRGVRHRWVWKKEKEKLVDLTIGLDINHRGRMHLSSLVQLEYLMEFLNEWAIWKSPLNIIPNRLQ